MPAPSTGQYAVSISRCAREIEEAGSHEELLDAGGLYAEWFNLQAEGYR